MNHKHIWQFIGFSIDKEHSCFVCECGCEKSVKRKEVRGEGGC